MIRVGETSGNLEEILEILSLQLEKEHELASKVKGALVYPAVIIVAMIGIGIVMLTFILPKLMGVFSDMSVELPASTKFVIGLSKALTNHSISIIVGTVFLGIFYALNRRRKEWIKRWWLMTVATILLAYFIDYYAHTRWYIPSKMCSWEKWLGILLAGMETTLFRKIRKTS